MELADVSIGYGDVQVVHSVNMRVTKGELVVILGSNGAGKTTVLKSVAGLLRPVSGRILFEGKDLRGVPVHERSRKGIVLVNEGRQLFMDMSVLSNLLVASISTKSRRRENLDNVFGLFPILKERQNQRAGTLSGGEQQMLAIGRALMCSPKLLMLDEPSLGLAPLMVKLVFEAVEQLRKTGLTVAMAEQNVTHSLKMCDRGYVMETGNIVLEGRSADLLNDERTKKAYIAL